jgi:hypothetical protein
MNRAAWTKFFRHHKVEAAPTPQRRSPLPQIIAPTSITSCGVPVTFIARLDLPPSTLSPNVTLAHWAQKRASARKYRKASWFAFMLARPHGWTPGPVVIDVVYEWGNDSVGYRPHDEDNARASLKAALDGMRDAGIVPDDSVQFVRWGAFELRSFWGGVRGGVTITVRRA